MRDGKEHGYVVCNVDGTLKAGRETVGHHYGVSVDVRCRRGTPIAVFHTHPGGKPVPSDVDMVEAQRYGIPWMCVGVPETGEVRCHRVPKAR